MLKSTNIHKILYSTTNLTKKKKNSKTHSNLNPILGCNKNSKKIGYKLQLNTIMKLKTKNLN